MVNHASNDLLCARALKLWDLEQEAKLAVFVDCLEHWQKTLNLVAPSSMREVWMRHMADSAQVVSLVDKARTWVDFGSGSGFPGIVAAVLRGGDGACVTHLVESDQRKCGFLRHVSRETSVKTVIHNMRIEEFLRNPPSEIDVVSARALASFEKLLQYSSRFLLKGATALFHKGQYVDLELTQTAIDSRFVIEKVQSRTNDASHILRVTAMRGAISTI